MNILKYPIAIIQLSGSGDKTKVFLLSSCCFHVSYCKLVAREL